MAPSDPCPCGRTGAFGPLTFAACCDRYLGEHGDREPAPDAESLMRSRYTAHVMRRGDYLLDTWHPSTRPRLLDLDAGTRWLDLTVLDHRRLGGDRAEVAFEARYTTPAQFQEAQPRAAQSRAAHSRERVLAERSRFARVEGRWLYLGPA